MKQQVCQAVVWNSFVANVNEKSWKTRFSNESVTKPTNFNDNSTNQRWKIESQHDSHQQDNGCTACMGYNCSTIRFHTIAVVERAFETEQSQQRICWFCLVFVYDWFIHDWFSGALPWGNFVLLVGASPPARAMPPRKKRCVASPDAETRGDDASEFVSYDFSSSSFYSSSASYFLTVSLNPWYALGSKMVTVRSPSGAVRSRARTGTIPINNKVVCFSRVRRSSRTLYFFRISVEFL